MSWLKKLFQRKKKHAVPVGASRGEAVETACSRPVLPRPSWDETVEMMYDRKPGGFTDDLVRVIYSGDKTRRFVVLKNERGLYKYCLEELVPWTDDEWYYFSRDGVWPATWVQNRSAGNSVFDSEETLLEELQETPEYKRIFCD